MAASCDERGRQVHRASRRRRRPDAEPVHGEAFPGKQLARIGLARRRGIAVADDSGGRQPMAITDRRGELDQRSDLLFWKGPVAPFVPRIDQLDADRMAVDVGDVAPAAKSSMPGSALVGHELADQAVLVDDVVGADRGNRIAEPGDGSMLPIACRCSGARARTAARRSAGHRGWASSAWHRAPMSCGGAALSLGGTSDIEHVPKSRGRACRENLQRCSPYLSCAPVI